MQNHVNITDSLSLPPYIRVIHVIHLTKKKKKKTKHIINKQKTNLTEGKMATIINQCKCDNLTVLRWCQSSQPTDWQEKRMSKYRNMSIITLKVTRGQGIYINQNHHQQNQK